MLGQGGRLRGLNRTMRFASASVVKAMPMAAVQRAALHAHRRARPEARRACARGLLSSIVREQRWGIAPVAHARGCKAFFKGGRRKGIVHQVALLERDGARVSLAIHTGGQLSMAYGDATLAGIASGVVAQ